MLDDNRDMAMMKIVPNAPIPMHVMIEHFAQRCGYEQWQAIILSDEVVVVIRIEGSLS